MPIRDHEVIVVGGGLCGAAIAWGLARGGQDTLVLDGADLDRRASRANFGLVWVSAKGSDAPAYALWGRDSAHRWPALARELAEQTDIDVALNQLGGYQFALDDGALEKMQLRLQTITRQTGGALDDYQVLDHADIRARVPGIGSGVQGAIYSPHDGHVNPLRLLRALHAGLTCCGAQYLPDHRVDAIEPGPDGYLVKGPWGQCSARKIVLAAGLGSARLAPLLGLQAHLVSSKGQILVTERCPPFFSHASACLRQTHEGSVLIGESQELDTDTFDVNHDISAVLAQRAIQTFPAIAELNVIRAWTGLRIKTRDGLPVYQQSADHPGAFLVHCHSGVTLAAAHALILAPQIAAGQLDPTLSAFSTSRFKHA